MNERKNIFEENQLLTETEAAKFLGFTARTLQNWRLNGKGPSFIRISGRIIKYKLKDLIFWSDRKKQNVDEVDS